MGLDERVISRAIIERYTEKLLACIDIDVAIVGAGPAGIVAAHDLAKAGRRVVVFERKLSVGGGMWGGGMMFNEIVVQSEAKRILDAFGIRTREFTEGYHTADSVECVTGLCHRAVQAGATFLNLVSVEDVVLREERLAGIVINWTAVQMAGLHVDPLSVESRYVIDCTGHDTDVVRMVEGKAERSGQRLLTPSGRIEGQRPLWAERAEQATIENTREVFPGLYVAGMSANATWGSFRMGPIFGGMLLSGEKVAQLVNARLEQGA